ncbi:MAG TPA: NADH-ubiquinone oxidoreductase-F iron-sulfur binding region domain-containing protein [Candidatus Binataceae bacterium]|nr:NADH-ubiquinone oxidoreductase-F iron-sulfur binding region domain-containing protein [Candidatus Binataceae bacterium]
MNTAVYVPCDSGAVSLGAGAVADAVALEAKRRGADFTLVRNGSRGLYWLEPMVEVETARGRWAYGPVAASDVPSLFDADFLAGGQHRLALGPTAEIPYLRNQERLTFARVGVTDPVSVDRYVIHGGYRGLERALTMTGAQIVEEVTLSGLRGRGGAGFPAGIKWKTTLGIDAPQKYIVCNADEGDSGTFSDRMIMEGDPLLLIEGMTIAAIAVGASEGFIYLRSEYPDALRALNEAIAAAARKGYLGGNLCGSGKAFNLEVRVGAGAYICGEETAMLESLEGKRGMVRFKPPLPAIAGLFGRPTIINNVITLASVPVVLDQGANFYKEYGMGRSRGTLPIQLAGNVKRPGLVEKAFGVSLREIVYEYGGGTASGRPVRAVQVGGPLGAYFPESMLDLPLDYEALAAKGGLVGHGGVVVFDDTVDLAQQARYAMEFCALESCGKCTPCRIGSTRGMELIDQILMGNRENADILRELCDTMSAASLCALGGLTPLPVMSALKHFPQDFGLPAGDAASASTQR